MRELVIYGIGQLKTLGKERGGLYIKRCLAQWAKDYGQHVADKIRNELLKFVKGMK